MCKQFELTIRIGDTWPGVDYGRCMDSRSDGEGILGLDSTLD